MSLLPPIRRNGPLTAIERAQLEELQRRDAQTTSAQIIDTHFHERRAQVENRLAAFDRAIADAIEEIAPRAKARAEGWEGQVLIEGIGRVCCRELRAYLEKITARTKAFLISRLGDDPDPQSDEFLKLFGSETTATLASCVVFMAEYFAESVRNRYK
jgi:hypothetical protein